MVTYAELDERVRERADALGPVRRLVLLTGGNDVETVVSYLAALRGGHPLLLASPDADGPLLSTYRPDVVVSGGLLEERHAGTAHDLHPDLALMLSTSGSTGSPKLVRLSHENVRSNAASIASYLGLTADDRAATSLPLHYCYGLSVLNSHLPSGQPAADRRVGRRRTVLDRVRRRGGHVVRRGALHLRPARRRWLRRPGPAVAALHHPGRRPHGPRPRPAVRPPGPRARLRPRRDVRPDRGDRPDGLPARRTWPRPGPTASASPSPAAACGSSPSTARAAARRSASSCTPART